MLQDLVPPSGGSLEIGNQFVGGPNEATFHVPPSGGSLEIGNTSWVVPLPLPLRRSPFGGIPRNWKHRSYLLSHYLPPKVPPSGGSLEIGNWMFLFHLRLTKWDGFPLRGDP